MLTMPTALPLAAIDPTLVIWFIVGIVYFMSPRFLKKLKATADREAILHKDNARGNRPPTAMAEEELAGIFGTAHRTCTPRRRGRGRN